MKHLSRTGTLVLGLVVALIVLTPLPEGSAYPWALAVIEAVIFGLVALWMLANALKSDRPKSFLHAWALALPVLLFIAMTAAQLAPLPPAVLRTMSPATYRLYKLSLPGWPGAEPRRSLPAAAAESTRWNVLPTVDEVASGAKVPFDLAARVNGDGQAQSPAIAARAQDLWRTLSIAPSITAAVLLEVTAYAALFFLILLYPFGLSGIETERAVCRAIVMAALLSGLIVAVVGIIEFFTWNGKILWMFIPYDWGVPHPGALARALGPFVNPDHFGDYLALVLPLAAGGALFRSQLFSKAREFRVLSTVTAFLIICALLLSLSRGAWVASLISLAVLFGLSARMHQEVRPRFLRLGRGTLLRRTGVLAFGMVALCLFFIGPQGRRQIDLRLQQTVYSESGFHGRLELAADTLAMVRDYPVFGVGMGCWPELFPHYRRPPWAAVMYREAHNDYAQLLAETGILGFALAAWFFIAIAKRLYHRLAREPAAVSLALAAVCAALAVITFHEFFDFSVHTPANALLFTVLLALAVRMADGPRRDSRTSSVNGPGLRVVCGCVSAAAVVLIVCAFKQQKIPYPHDIVAPVSATGAIRLLFAHPAESAPHLDLVRLGGKKLSPEQRLAQLHAAVWLDPTNPYARDPYARELLRQGMKARALTDITRSIAASPSLATHAYLSARLIAWLSPSEKNAVEKGFRKAIELHYQGAVKALTEFYASLGRFADAAKVYREAAESERNPRIREDYLVGGGISYARSGDTRDAQELLESAIRDDPTDIRPYHYLATAVFGPQHRMKAAQSVIAAGIRAGADGPALYDALANAAQADGDSKVAESALRHAVAAQPTFDSLMRLGIFYMNDGQYDHAAFALHRATELNPHSANAYFRLGLAEEDGYRFSDAERDFAIAVRLAPANTGYRAHYAGFERKLAQSIKLSRAANQ